MGNNTNLLSLFARMGSYISFPLMVTVFFISCIFIFLYFQKEKYFNQLNNYTMKDVQELAIYLNRLEEIDKQIDILLCTLNKAGNLEVKSLTSKDLMAYYAEKLRALKKVKEIHENLSDHLQEVMYCQ